MTVSRPDRPESTPGGHRPTSLRRRTLLLTAAAASVLVGACTSAEDAGPSTVAPLTTETTAETASDDSSDSTDEPVDDTGDDDTTTEDPPGRLPSGAAVFTPAPLEWSGCEFGECATLVVPLDYDDPDGETIEIAVARQAAGGDAIGSVVINPGGPGGSGLEYLRFASLLLPGELQDRFDLVSFDPRGVGASSSIDCDIDFDDAIPTLESGDDVAWEAFVAEEEASLDTCEGLDLAPFVGTNNAARDLDVLREALGDEGLTYIGYSYGTRLGATYAELFPQNVRALVLDAAVLPDPDLETLDTAQADGFDLAFGNFAAACDADPDCPLAPIGESTIDVFDGIAAEIEAEGPLVVDDGRQLTLGEYHYGVLAALYSVESWPILAEGLFVADTLGDGTIVQLLADSLIGRDADGTYDNSNEANFHINCADDPSRGTIDEARAAADDAAERTEYFDLIFRAGTGCVFAPDPIDPLAVGPATGAPPIVVIGNTGDPATPYQWSVDLAASIDSAVLYTVEGEGHTAYGSFDCLADDITAYLVDLEVPADGTTCSENATADFFPPRGESEIDRVVAFFACLRDEGLEIEAIDTADILADPTGEELFAAIDLEDPEVIAAVFACQDVLGA